MSDILILVITHKNYEFPSDNIFQPIFVGENKPGSSGYLSDDLGENIAQKNESFCELTGLYWAWKNHLFDSAKYIGLVHYRRYFKGKTLTLKGKKIASENELLPLLKEYDCILPKKRNYFIETIYSHYKNAHHIKDLELIKRIITKIHPSYLPTFEQVMNGKKIHLYNMFIMKKEHIYSYCEWLFPILFILEKQIDISNYDNYQKRIFGFLAERLFNVWILHNKLKIKESKVITLEYENLLKKAFGLIKRKFKNIPGNI